MENDANKQPSWTRVNQNLLLLLKQVVGCFTQRSKEKVIALIKNQETWNANNF